MAEGEELVRRYLNGEEKSVFVIHRLVKEWRTQKRTYVFSLDLVFYLLLVDSAVGGTKYCNRLGKSDVIELHLKVASTIRGCEAYGVIILFSMGSVCPEPYELKILCLLRVDSASKHNNLANKTKAYFV
jgi:hypothetical protein